MSYANNKYLFNCKIGKLYHRIIYSYDDEDLTFYFKYKNYYLFLVFYLYGFMFWFSEGSRQIFVKSFGYDEE
jgi:hypothetical protein